MAMSSTASWNSSSKKFERETECRIITFEYIYDEEDQESQSLEGKSDEGLSRIIAGGSGVV